MQEAITAMIAIAALFFSITCALLLEKFIFGGLFHLLRPLRRRDSHPLLENNLFGASEK